LVVAVNMAGSLASIGPGVVGRAADFASSPGMTCARAGHPEGGGRLTGMDDDARESAGSLPPVTVGSRIAARYRATDPARADAVVTAIVIVLWALEALAVDSAHGYSRAVTFVGGSVALLALVVRRTNPLAAVIWFVAASLVLSQLDSFFLENATLPFVALIWLGYSAGRHMVGRRMVAAGLILGLGFSAALTLSDTGFEIGDLPFAVLFVFAPLLVGRGLANRARLQAELRTKATEAAEQSRREAERAVELERGRIASELQAVVANGISAMVVQAEAVPAMLAGVNGSADREGAGSALAVIEETGRDTLAEMRRLLGVLRHAGEGALLAPQPSLERIGTLIEAAQLRGLTATLAIEGERGEVASGVELSAYRTIEAALQGAAEAGAEHAAVTVEYGERELGVVVTDDRDPAAPTADDELASLSSRLGIYGGRLAADHHDDGYSVRVRLPRELR
jgi:signal transduction histidine kinase